MFHGKQILMVAASLCLMVSAEPKPTLPVIEVHSSPVPGVLSPSPTSANGTIELTPIEGQKPEKLSGRGRYYWNSPYGMPAGPGRAWPDAAPPGASGPAGGMMTPLGYPR